MKRFLLHILMLATLSTAFMLPAIASAQATTPATTPTAPSTNPTTAPDAPVAAPALPAGVANSAQVADSEDTCSWGNIVCALNPATWVPKVLDASLELYLLPVAGWIFALSGFMLDWAINYSLNFATQAAAAGSSIVLGWTIVRDIFNIFFIFALIYIAITTMVGETGFLGKTTLKNIIIAALLINFSFFFTEVLIDGGNIVGGWLYQGIETTLQSSNAIGGLSGNISISAGLSGALGVFSMYNTNGQSALALIGAGLNDTTARLIGGVIRLAVVIFATYVFAYVAVLFLGRTVSLLFLLVMSPIGFAGWILPITKDMSEEWQDEMKKNILLAPAFLLYLYIIIAFVSSPIFSSTNLVSGGITGTNSAFNPTQYFKYFLLAAMLLYALKKAKKFSGLIGNMLGGLAKQIASAIAGVAVGVATGGTSMALQATVGAAGSAMAGSKTVKDMVGGESRIGRLVGGGLKNIGTSASKATFDGGKIASGIAGSMDAKISIPKVLQSQKEGYVGAQKARTKKAEETADYLAATKDEEKIVNSAIDKHRETTNTEVANSLAGQTNTTEQTKSTRRMNASRDAIQGINTDLTDAKNRNDIPEQNRLNAELKTHQSDYNKEAEKLKTLQSEYDDMLMGEIKKKLEIERKTDKGLDEALDSTDRLENYAKNIEKGSTLRKIGTAAAKVPLYMASPASIITAGAMKGMSKVPVVGKYFKPLDPAEIKKFLATQNTSADKKVADAVRESQKEENKNKRKEEKSNEAFFKKLQAMTGGGSTPPSAGGTPPAAGSGHTP